MKVSSYVAVWRTLDRLFQVPFGITIGPMEDLPPLSETMQEQLAVYRRVRDALYSRIASELLLEIDA